MTSKIKKRPPRSIFNMDMSDDDRGALAILHNHEREKNPGSRISKSDVVRTLIHNACRLLLLGQSLENGKNSS
jgi:hypothetical protein